MKTFRAKFNPQSKNVYAVSLVENPAMEGDFIQFSKQEEIKFTDVDTDKRRVMGLILEPNKLIYRNQGGQEFNVMFTEQDIEDVAYNFQKQSNQKNSTLEHEGKNIEGVTFVETWIVENPKIDKSTNFGFSYPKGSWMGVMQIDNDDVWLNYVETGKVKGFSIDAFMQLEEINFNTEIMSDKKDDLGTKIMDAIKTGFASLKATKEVEVKEVEEVKAEETVELKEEINETETKVEFNQDTFLAELIKEVEALFNPIKEENVGLKKQVEEFETKFKDQEERLLELEKQPATKPVNKVVKEVNYSELSNLEKMEYNQRNKR